LKKLGVADGTPLEKLSALKAAGIVSPEQLKKAGLGEIRQQAALNNLIENLPRIPFILREIQTKAVPGVFQTTRAGIESEIPLIMFQRQIAQLRAELKDEFAFGDRAIPALESERLALARGLAVQKHGGALGRLLVSPETGIGPKAFGAFAVGAGLVNTLDDFASTFTDKRLRRPDAGRRFDTEALSAEIKHIYERLNEAAALQQQAAQDLSIAARDLRTGGPALPPAQPIGGGDR